jgi:hypothetical protein
MTRSLLWFFCSLLLALPTRQLAASETANAYYLVFELDSSHTFHPMAAKTVRMRSVPRSKSGAEIAEVVEANTADEVVLVTVDDAYGNRVHADAIPLSSWIRSEYIKADGEFADAGSLATKHTVPIRVPLIPGAHLTLQVAGKGQPQWFSAWDLVTDQSLPLASYKPDVSLASPEQPSSTTNQLQILIMSEGYKFTQQSKFNTDKTNLQNAILAVSPFKEYAPYIAFPYLFSQSTDSGADRPKYQANCSVVGQCCRDPQAPATTTLVTTAFDVTYCSNLYSYRFLGGDMNKIAIAASQFPDYNLIILLVNYTDYGATAFGSVAFVSTSPQLYDVSSHELGHITGYLGDEYTDSGQPTSVCDDFVPGNCPRNETDKLARADIKWSAWIPQGVSLPMDPAAYPNTVGLFAGAFNHQTLMYRPWADCKMRTNGRPFCPICRQSIVLNLYDPYDYNINNILAVSPPEGPTSLAFPGNVSFGATFNGSLPQGRGISWSVNGVHAATLSGSAFVFNPPGTGTYTVTLKARDSTPFVLQGFPGGTLESSKTWTVSVGSSGSGISVASFSPLGGPTGTPVTISGGGFAAGSTVKFGSVTATPVTVVGSGTINTVAPANLPPGTMNSVSVTSPGHGTSSQAQGWFSNFSDVSGGPYYNDIRKLIINGVSGGCSGGRYCPGDGTTRAQMAVFLLKAKYGSFYYPAPATGGIFTDIQGNPLAAWIEHLFAYQITAGCNPTMYCPDQVVTRAQMAVFLLKTKYGFGYVPPAPQGIFSDVDRNDPFAPWIEALYAEGVTGGCATGPLRYCPNDPVTREQMATFLVKTFGLTG